MNNSTTKEDDNSPQNLSSTKSSRASVLSPDHFHQENHHEKSSLMGNEDHVVDHNTPPDRTNKLNLRRTQLMDKLEPPNQKGLVPGIKYKLHIPFQIHNIPHTEGFILWDTFKHHFHSEEKHKPHVEEGVDIPSEKCRILVIVALWFLCFGASMGYSSVGALSTFIQDEYDVGESSIGLLFSLYSVLNVFTVLFIGVLLDNWGHNKSCLLCLGLICLGFLIPLIKLFTPKAAWFPTLAIGRIVYGVGIECMGVVQNALLARWFAHDEKFTLSIVNAIMLASYRLSGFLSMVMFPNVAATLGLDVALIFAAWIAIASTAFGAAVLIITDKKHKAYLKPAVSSDPFHVKDFLKFSLTLYVLSALSMLFYSEATFIGFSTSFISDKWNVSSVTAGWITSSYYIAALLCLPFCGYAIDKFAHRNTIMALGCLNCIVAFILLLWTKVNPLVPCVLLGLSYGVVPGALWPSVPLITTEKTVGTAFGLVSCMSNFGMFIVPLVAAEIDKDVDFSGIFTVYASSGVFFVLFLVAFLALASSVWLWFIDFARGSILETTRVLKLENKKQ